MPKVMTGITVNGVNTIFASITNHKGTWRNVKTLDGYIVMVHIKTLHRGITTKALGWFQTSNTCPFSEHCSGRVEILGTRYTYNMQVVNVWTFTLTNITCATWVSKYAYHYGRLRFKRDLTRLKKIATLRKDNHQRSLKKQKKKK